VLARGVIFVDLSLAQVAAFGATLAILFGFEHHSTATYLISLGSTFAAAALFALARRHERLFPQEAIIGIVYAVAAAAVVLVVDRIAHGAEHIKDVLVGQVLWVTWDDVVKTGVIYGAVRGVRSRGPQDPIPNMSTWRGRYVIRGRRQIAGGGFNIEVSVREMKEAWRSGAWLADPWWRFVFYMAAAATVMIVGLFGLFFMIGFAGLRLVVAGALLYAVARTWWGFMIA
jgi:hypothetical protein